MTKFGLSTGALAAFAALCAWCVRNHAMGVSAVGLTPAAASAEVRGSTIVLRGTVPDAGTRQAFVAGAGEVFGPANVLDSLVVDRTTEARWKGSAPGVLGALRLATSGASVSWMDSTVVLRGEVAAESLRTQALSAIRAAHPGLQVIDSLVVLTAERAPALQAAIDRELSGTTVQFASGSATITRASLAVLDRIANDLQQVPSATVSIDGHTDGVGDPDGNLALSRERAEAVKAYLVRKGIAGERLTANGYGATRPKVPGNTDAANRANRRIELTVH